jgi:hypothetical protein
MAMGARATPGQGSKQEDGDVHVPVVGPDELIGAALEGQVFLANSVHPANTPVGRRLAEPDSRR